MGYGDQGEMGYRIWLPQFKKIVCSRDEVYNEAKLMSQNLPIVIDSKRVKFQPPHMTESNLCDALPEAEIQNQRVIFKPENVG